MADSITEYRAPNGRLIAPIPGSEKTRITAANARTMVQKRWENYRRKAVERIVEEAKSIDPSVSVGADAFGLVAAKQFSALMDSDKPRIADLEKLGQIMTGMSESQRENAAAGEKNITFGDPVQLLDLLDELERRKQAAVDQARAIEGHAE